MFVAWSPDDTILATCSASFCSISAVRCSSVQLSCCVLGFLWCVLVADVLQELRIKSHMRMCCICTF